MKDLTHISLFAGIGGIDIATEWAGFRTILFVEINEYCQKVLKKHWPDVPIIGDIRDATKERIMAYAESGESGEQEARNGRQGAGGGSKEETIANATSKRSHNQEDKQELEEEGGNKLHIGKSRDTKAVAHTKGSGQLREEKPQDNGEDSKRGRRYDSGNSGQDSRHQQAREDGGISPVTLITGGFPCQPVSAAGKRRGKEDDRWLWPEMFRVIEEVRPKWVVAENVAGLIRMGIDDCLSDLENIGYTTELYLIPACAVNAPHRRDRIFIVGYSASNRRVGGRTLGRTGQGEVSEIREDKTNQQTGDRRNSRFGKGSPDVADTKGNRMERGKRTRATRSSGIISNRSGEDVADPIIGTKRSSHRKGSDKRRSDSKQDDRDSLGDDIRNGGKATSDSNRSRCTDRTKEHRGEQAQEGEGVSGTGRPSAIPDTQEEGLEGSDTEGAARSRGCPAECLGSNWWAVEPDVGRVVDGLSSELDIARQIRDWCRNEYSNNKKAKSERDRLTRLFLRSVWEHRKLAKTSPQSYIRAVQDSVSEVPLRDTQSRWYLGAWVEETQSLCDMWKQFYTSPQQEPQDLQYKLLERAREIKRPKTVASRVDRLKCLGNAVVPAQIYPILKAIADMENGHCN